MIIIVAIVDLSLDPPIFLNSTSSLWLSTSKASLSFNINSMEPIVTHNSAINIKVPRIGPV